MIRAHCKRKPDVTGDQHRSASTLLEKDFRLVSETPALAKDVVTVSPNFLTWKFRLSTDVESVYAGRQYTVIVNFHRHYPIEPPSVTLCFSDSDNTRYNPLPLEARQHGDLEIERFLPDLWRPMSGVDVLLCVKDLFNKKRTSFRLSNAKSEMRNQQAIVSCHLVNLVSLFSHGSGGEARMLLLAECLGVQALSILSTTCTALLTAAMSERVWGQLYFSNVTIPPISLYSIADFDLLRIKAPCGAYHWSGARDALQRTFQVHALKVDLK